MPRAYLVGYRSPANVLHLDDREARLIEITENLHRAELSALERSEQIAEWVRLTEGPKEVLGQVASKPNGGRPESGIRQASRDLGLEHREVRRSIKVASLTDEAKAVASEVGLSDNRSALLEAAERPKEEQADTLRAISSAGGVAAYRDIAFETLQSDDHSIEHHLNKLKQAWNKAPLEARNSFIGWIGGTVH